MNENLLTPFEIGFIIGCVHTHKHRDGIEKELQRTITTKLLKMAKYYETSK